MSTSLVSPRGSVDSERTGSVMRSTEGVPLTGKSFDADPNLKVHFFEEIWRIYEFEGGNYTVEGFAPADLVMEGHDTGITNIKNSKYHMNGSVDVAEDPFEEWIGRSVHMRGVVADDYVIAQLAGFVGLLAALVGLIAGRHELFGSKDSQIEVQEAPAS